MKRPAKKSPESVQIPPVINLSAKKPTLPHFSEHGISILESHHVPGFTMPPSKYDFSEVMLVLDGRGWVVQGNIRHPVEKNHIVIVPRGIVYHYEDNERTPLAMWALCIRPPEALKNLFSPVLPSRFAVLRTTAFCREVASELRAIFYGQSRMRRSSASATLGHTLILLEKIAHRLQSSERTNDEMNSREVEALVRVRDYVEKLEHFFHEQETLEMVALRLGMSPRSLSLYFRRITGMSRLRYIQDLRLRHACHLLAATRQSVTSIAFACGFDDLSNFFHVFRSAKDRTPNQWRQEIVSPKRKK